MVSQLIFNNINFITIFSLCLLYVYQVSVQDNLQKEVKHLQWIYLCISIAGAFFHLFSKEPIKGYIFDGDVSKTQSILFLITLGIMFFSLSILSAREFKHSKFQNIIIKESIKHSPIINDYKKVKEIENHTQEIEKTIFQIRDKVLKNEEKIDQTITILTKNIDEINSKLQKLI